MFGRTRPPTSQVMELHVFYVPEEVWNFKLNTVSAALSSKFISAGFIRRCVCTAQRVIAALGQSRATQDLNVCIARMINSPKVPPHITLRVLREKLGEYLGGVAVADKFIFLKCIGKKLAVSSVSQQCRQYKELSLVCRVKAKQEAELELKSFAPPYALYPELYLLPGVEYFEDAYPISSSTQERHHFNEEASGFGHGSRLSRLLPTKNEKSEQFLESRQSSHLLGNTVHGSLEWDEKESILVMHTNHKQGQNIRIQEKKVQLGEKDDNGSSGALFVPNNSKTANGESGKNSPQNSQQNPLCQEQKQHNAPKWNDKAKETALTLHVNHYEVQGQNNPIPTNCIKYQKELNPKLLATTMENNDHEEDTKLRRNRAQNSGMSKMWEDQTIEHIHSNHSLQQYRTGKSVADSGEKQDNQADENNQNHLIFPKEYLSPPSPPFLALPVNPAQVLTVQTEKNEIAEKLQQMKKDRRYMEKTREDLIKKAKGLLEQNKLRRYHVREEWKKKYFETKKATASLEDILNKLRQDFELYYQKLLLQLEARDTRKQPNNAIASKNNTIIRIITVQYDIDQLRKQLDDTKMKLVIEIKMRKQAASDLQALRAELTQKKIHSSFILQSGKAGI